MPNVSIIMPALNSEKYIAASIESVINQTYTDLELIITDSHSTDNTAAIVKSYCERYPFIQYYLTDAKLTLSGNCNAGFKQAKGRYWTRLCSDDLFLPRAIERMLAYLEEHPEVGVVYCQGEFINPEGEVIGNLDIKPIDQLIYKNSAGVGALCRAEVAKKTGPFSEEYPYCEDYDYWFRLSQTTNCQPLYERLYQYRIHTHSLSHRFEALVIKNSLRLQKSYYKQFIKTRRQAALFYAQLRARDIFNPWRQLYLIPMLYYSPKVFWDAVYHKVIADG